MSEAAILEALRRGLITPEQAKARLNPERQTGLGEAAVRSFAQGITLGGVDELASGIGAATDTLRGKQFGESYNRRLNANRSQDALIAKQRPAVDTAGKIAGGVVGATGAALAAPGSTLLNPATATQLARSGGAFGAAQGFLSGEGNAGNRAADAVLGGAVGAATGYGAGRLMDRFLPNTAPSVDKLKESYVTARQSLRDVPIERQAMREALQPVVNDLQYIRNSVDPAVLGAVDDLQRAPNAYAVDLVRSNIPGKSPQGAELRQTLDKFLETQNVDPAFRDQYRRAMLATKVQDAISRFDTSEAQARTALQNVAKNTKGIKPFEREAILKAAKAPFKIGNLTGAVLSLGGAGPAATAATYAGSRAFDGVMSDASGAAMNNALNTILSGQRMPSYLQRFGALVAPAARNVGRATDSALGANSQGGFLKLPGQSFDNLPMDTASRMQRAREMGFDVDNPVYHGTGADIAQFKPSIDGKMGAGVYLSDSPVYSSSYANREGGNVIKAVTKGNIAGGKEASAASEQARMMLKNDPKTAELPAREFNQLWREKRNEILAQQGFDGLKLSDETVVFDPKNIRSVNAAFNPAKKESSKLLAGVAPIGLTGLIGYNGIKERK